MTVDNSTAQILLIATAMTHFTLLRDLTEDFGTSDNKGPNLIRPGLYRININ